MNIDEKRLLMACASCLLGALTGDGPDDEAKIRVLRRFLAPFEEFLREDMKQHMAKMVAEIRAEEATADDAEDYRSGGDAN